MGGVGEPYTLNSDQEQVAIRAARCVGADICGVDMLLSNQPYVLEVNLSPGLEGISAATKKNVARIIAEFLYEKTKEFTSKQSLKTPKKINEVITNLSVKAGIIKLPSVVSKMSELIEGDEVAIKVTKGIIKIIKTKDVD
jgi:hypothetical protein